MGIGKEGYQYYGLWVIMSIVTLFVTLLILLTKPHDPPSMTGSLLFLRPLDFEGSGASILQAC